MSRNNLFILAHRCGCAELFVVKVLFKQIIIILALQQHILCESFMCYRCLWWWGEGVVRYVHNTENRVFGMKFVEYAHLCYVRMRISELAAHYHENHRLEGDDRVFILLSLATDTNFTFRLMPFDFISLLPLVSNKYSVRVRSHRREKKFLVIFIPSAEVEFFRPENSIAQMWRPTGRAHTFESFCVKKMYC